MRSSCQFAREDFDQRIYRFIPPSEPFDFRDCVKDRRVVPAVVEFSNLRKAPAAHMLPEVHRHLPAEARTLRIAQNTARSDVSRDNSLIDYLKVGKESYRIVGAFDQFEYRRTAPLFQRLAEQFEYCVHGLNR